MDVTERSGVTPIGDLATRPTRGTGASDMTTEHEIVKKKVGLLELGRQLGNV